MNCPLSELDKLTMARFAWLNRDAEKVRQWREDDRAAGIIWNDEIHREAGAAEKAPGQQ